MSGPIGRFDPSELVGPDEPAPPVSEQADAMLAARDLETLAANDVIGPTEGFEDRVMAAIAAEPAPRLVVRPASMVHGGRLGAFLIAVRESWGVATTGGRPVAVRAQALALVLLVALAVGTMTTVAAVGVGSVLTNRVPGPTDAGPSHLPVATESPETAEPTESPEASETAEPTETAEPGETAKPGETAGPHETAKPGETPRATRTPRPTKTPKPGETQEPSETPEASDDHGGSPSGSGPG